MRQLIGICLLILGISYAQGMWGNGDAGVVEVFDDKSTVICKTAGGTTRTNVLVVGETYKTCTLDLKVNPSKTWPGNRTFYVFVAGWGLQVNDDQTLSLSIELGLNPVRIIKNRKDFNSVSFANDQASPVRVDAVGKAKFEANFSICVANPQRNERPCWTYFATKIVDVLPK